MNNNPLKKIMYVHYQLSELDGSNTHTTAFEYWFSAICKARKITFKVQAPTLNSTAPPLKKKIFSKIKSVLAQYYLRDVKVWMQNYQQMQREMVDLKREQPDIVLTRFERETVSIIWACRKLNIPVVLEINSPDIEAITAHYKSLPYFKKLFSTSYVLNYALGGFMVTDNLRAQVQKKGTFKDKILNTIPNGVDIDKFTPDIEGQSIRKLLNIDEEVIVIGFVGSFAPWHGIDIIAEAFPQLLKQGHKVHLMLVGQVQAQTNSLINQLLHSEHREQISLTGFIALQEIPTYLAAMDITVLANTEDYCSPLKLFEYMAMGKAVVSVNTPAVCDIMRPDQEGLVFERGNVAEFGEQILKFIEDASLRETLGINARKRMVADFQWKHNAMAVFELINACYAKKTY